MPQARRTADQTKVEIRRRTRNHRGPDSPPADMAYAKATLGKVAALQGNVPLSLLQLGEPRAVREYCRKLIEMAAPGVGFLLDSGAVIHQSEAENIRAMVQAAHDFGVY